MYQTLLVRYGEISLKGRNRYKFENILIDNMKFALKDVPHGKISKTFGRIYVKTENNWKQITDKLLNVFGIVSISPVIHTGLDITEIKNTALQLIQQTPISTFKVQTKRPNKMFPMNTPEVNQSVGGHILQNTSNITVDVHNPDTIINIEIRKEGAYIFSEVIPALKGLPVGTSGKGLLLLSGGIDSPVAGYLTMKRGVTVEGLHFYSYPFTTERSKQKVIDLAKVLSNYSAKGKFKLWIAYFTEIQKALQKSNHPDFKITLMRRLMLRIATRLAIKENALCLITGESLGQVASQTMESIHTINAVTNIPIFRPLIGMDKQEIVDISRKIDTFEISIQPYEDCCTIFVPKNPVTRPKIEQVLEAESELDIDGLVEESLERTEFVTVSHKTSIF